MSIQRSKSGFTLVELMVSMLAFSIMVLAVGNILISAWKAWHTYSEVIGMQRDSMIAMRTLSKEIRNSNINEITGNSAGIIFSGSNAVSYSATQIPHNPGVQLDSWTTPVIGSNYVDIAYSLKTTSGGGIVKTYQATFYPRNKP